MDQDIERAVQRARRYWYDDGLTEVGGGLVLLILGLMFMAEVLAPPGSLPRSFSAIGIVVIVAGGIWFVNWAVRRAKNSITYPRTGYVQYPRRNRSPRRRLLVGTLAFFLAVGTSTALNVMAPASHSWIPALQGAIIGAFILYMGYAAGLARFYLLAILSFVVGTAATVTGLDEEFGTGIYFVVMGIAFLLSGSITLATYLRRTKRSEAE
jgi:hypothetical protein